MQSISKSVIDIPIDNMSIYFSVSQKQCTRWQKDLFNNEMNTGLFFFSFFYRMHNGEYSNNKNIQMYFQKVHTNSNRNPRIKKKTIRGSQGCFLRCMSFWNGIFSWWSKAAPASSDPHTSSCWPHFHWSPHTPPERERGQKGGGGKNKRWG